MKIRITGTILLLALGGHIANAQLKPVGITKAKAASSQAAAMPAKVRALVRGIAENGMLQERYIGFAGAESDNYERYRQLKSTATVAQLRLLSADANTAVAGYAVWALADLRDPSLVPALDGFLTTPRKVQTFRGCIVSEEDLAIVLYRYYEGLIPEEDRPADPLLLRLDSVLLNSTATPELLLYTALGNRVYADTYLPAISRLAFERQQLYALLYLSNGYRYVYADKLKSGLLAWLSRMKDERSEVDDLYLVIAELLRFNDPAIKKAIALELGARNSWKQVRKERLLRLLEDNGMQLPG